MSSVTSCSTFIVDGLCELVPVLRTRPRYLRSIEALARVRKLMGIPMAQINIAAEGGQQVVSNA